ncbi:MAG TPA: NADP-dependent oxidoreductase [Pseudonocardia sp.]|nr:NADP-dependent oxidoreductase [Pseudonocardia sp.]
MRAVVHDRFGGPEVLRVAELAEPKTHLDSVLVRVKAAGVNPADLAMREGQVARFVPTYFPVVPGWDVAGVVERAGPGAQEFAPDDEVVGYVRGEVAHGNGGYAELVAADVRTLARKPRNASWAQAAALPLAGLTGYQAVGRLAVADGEVLLVHGAAGGVGSMATQIAVARGARVIGTAAPGNHAYLRSLGAEPVRYGDGLVERVRALAPAGVDAVLDVAGRDALATTSAVGARGVRVATVVGSAYPGVLAVFARMYPADLAAVVALVEAGRLTVRVAASYPLERAADAHRALAAGTVAGKIVLDVG